MDQLLIRLDDVALDAVVALIAVLLGLWIAVLVVASTRGSKPSKCPACMSDRIRLSWPRFYDKIVGITLLTAYRCLACEKRFYALERQANWNERF